MMRRRGVLALVSVLLFASCGGGGGSGAADVTVPAATGEDQSSGLIPNPNGFAFPNFGSAATPEVFNEADLVEMFGNTPDVCVDGADPCVATAEAAGWARMVNESRAAGHCEGFAVLAAARFLGAEQPNTVELVNQGDVTHALMRSFATQFFDETKDATKAIVKKSMRDKVAILEAAFAKKKVGDVVGVYSDVGGHALLPYAVVYESPDVAKVMVYDSNWPGQERFITVDMAAGTWTFPFAGADPANDPTAWTGDTKDFDIAPYDARIAGKCPFCKGETAARQTLLVIRSVAADWSIETSAGTLTPGSNDVGEATVRPMRSSAPTGVLPEVFDYMVTIPSGEIVTVTMPSLTRITGVTNRVTVQIDTPGSKDEPLTLSDNKVTTNDPATVVTLADKNFVATSNGANNTVVTDGNQVTATVNGADGNQVSATANEQTNAVEVRTPGREGVDENTNYELVTQTAPDQIERKVVSRDGREDVTNEQGTLANRQVYQESPNELKPPDVKAGLPSAASRTIGNAVASTTTTVPPTTTTIAAATTTTSTTTTIAGATTTVVAGVTTTAPRATPTTAATTRTTTAQNANARKNVTISSNLDNWTLDLANPTSSGFTAGLSGGLGQLDGAERCSDVACLETSAATILGGGVDPATGQETVVPVTFSMRGASGPFSIRCGAGGNWVAAANNGGTYSATCSFGNVTSDEAVYLRA
ncbi:MAG: hypothetical protein KJS66_02040 [Acidobacteria bacterium]|nr:hypothetical protein [Acidobacteriota bacterium]